MTAITNLISNFIYLKDTLFVDYFKLYSFKFSPDDLLITKRKSNKIKAAPSTQFLSNDFITTK